MSMRDPPLTGFSFEPLTDLRCKSAAGLRRPGVRARTAWRGTNCERPAAMARQRPKKKPERTAGGQLPLPTPRQPASSSTSRVLPMQLKVGDRLADETGEWEVIGRPYTTAGGKNAHVRLQRVGQSGSG